jgi:hypothetical protein
MIKRILIHIFCITFVVASHAANNIEQKDLPKQKILRQDSFARAMVVTTFASALGSKIHTHPGAAIGLSIIAALTNGYLHYKYYGDKHFVEQILGTAVGTFVGNFVFEGVRAFRQPPCKGSCPNAN